MQPVVTAAEMRALDRATIDELGLPGAVLMETAGRALAQAVLDGATEGHVAVVCGPGNNGGDGYVAARVLRERGLDAVVYLAVARDAVKGDARLHLDALERSGGIVLDLSTPAALDELGDALDGAAVIIDAIFGTGVTRAIEGHAAAVITRINAAGAALVVSADLPSGLDADTGAVHGVAVDADVTVTMGALKIGLVSAPGFARAGTVRVAEIGIPRALITAQVTRAGLLEASDVEAIAPRPHALDHKGRRGHVLVVGGSPGHRGAARLAAWAALRAGAGLCTLAGPGEGELVAPDPLMTARCDRADDLVRLVDKKAALAIGPGMLRGDEGAKLVDAALATGVPCVLDADALNHLAGGGLALVASAAAPAVLTPHPGEAARLLGCTVPDIERDRLAAVRKLAAESRAVVVLKGARTLICDGTVDDDFVAINPTGGPSLATGGTGDVLCGAIAALLAQGLAPRDAARLAVWVHGAAAELAAGASGARGVTASDVADHLGLALAALSS
jgi:ADP-dependent NAD(P)H-hydrate dehydratase / NAD(P)H-hydrate epimerase